MKGAVRVQGTLFCVAAVLAAAGSAVGRLAPEVELWLVVAMVVVFGVPHGALDPLLVRARPGLTRLRWAGFWLGYAGLGALVAGMWAWAPAVFLGGFLLVSALHFAGDLEGTASWPVRLLHGGAPVVGPAWLHGAEVRHLFGLLAGVDAAGAVMAVVQPLAGPWLVACLVAALVRGRADRWNSAELLCLVLLVAVAPPLLAFAVFFCAGHSARHVLRAATGTGAPLQRVLGQALAPMGLVLLGGGVAWWALRGVPVDARVVQVVFVGLAALTVPHMLVVWRWRKPGRAGHGTLEGGVEHGL